MARSTEKRSPIPPPASSGPLRPFVVRRPRWIWWTTSVITAMLVVGAVACIALGVANAENGAYICGGACLLVLLLFGPLTYSVVSYRLIVDPNGIHRVLRRRTGSLPWDQLEDVTIDRVKTGDVYADELFLVTPTGRVGPMGPAGLKSGLLHQLQATVLSYRDRVHAGNAHWAPAVANAATAYPRDRRLSGSSPLDGNLWEKRPEDFPDWLLLSARLFGVLLVAAVVVLLVKYR